MYKIGKAQLSSFQEDTPITVQLNEAEKVIDLHRFTVELSFDEHMRTKPSDVIQTDGTVTKIQPGLIDVKTPAGSTPSARRPPMPMQRSVMGCRCGSTNRIWSSTIMNAGLPAREAYGY